jgi:hypothetical protein
MLFRLLRSVKNLAYSILFENKIADNEARLYFGDDYDSKKE